MDSIRVPLASMPYLVMVLGISGLILRRIWMGRSGFSGLDRMIGQSLEPRWRQIFHTIAVGIFAIFFVAHSWILGLAPQHPEESAGAVRAWAYAQRVYYLTPHAYSILHDMEIVVGVAFAAFAAEMLWRQRRKQ